MIAFALLAVACNGARPYRPVDPPPEMPAPAEAGSIFRAVSGVPFVLYERTELAAGELRRTDFRRFWGVVSVRPGEAGAADLEFDLRGSGRTDRFRGYVEDAVDERTVVRVSERGAMTETPSAEERQRPNLLWESLWPVPETRETGTAEAAAATVRVAAHTRVGEGDRFAETDRQASVSLERAEQAVSAIDGELIRTTERFDGRAEVVFADLGNADGPSIPELRSTATIRLRGERTRSLGDGIAQYRHAVVETEVAGSRVRRESWLRIAAAGDASIPPIPFEAPPAPPAALETGCPEETRIVVARPGDPWVRTSRRELTRFGRQLEPAGGYPPRPGGLRLSFANHDRMTGIPPRIPERQDGAVLRIGATAERDHLRLDLVLRAPGDRPTPGEYVAANVYGGDELPDRLVEVKLFNYGGEVVVYRGGHVALTRSDGWICGSVAIEEGQASVRGVFVVSGPAGWQSD